LFRFPFIRSSALPPFRRRTFALPASYSGKLTSTIL
jgi:hypothetical protein